MNPRNYDLSELEPGPEETGGFEFDDNGHPADAGVAGAALRSSQHRELLMLQSMSDGMERPYLEDLPETYAAEIAVFEWLEYLLAKAGFRGALEALRFYRSIGWLTEPVEERLVEYLRSFDESGPEDPEDLSRSDHVTSLLYVARLSTMV